MLKFFGLIASLLFSPWALSYCSDADAIAAGETLGKGFFPPNKATVFYSGRVLKVHNPSKNKEVAAFIDAGDGRRYSIFSVVNQNCQARFIKRTRQND